MACGAHANTTKGNANTDENTSSPASGHTQSPWEATTSRVPRNGAVQVKDVNVNASPINTVPT